MYAPLVSKAMSKENSSVLLVPLNNCLPTYEFNINNECASLAKINFEAVLDDERIEKVVLAMTWEERSYYDTKRQSFDGTLDQVVESLLGMIQRYEKTGRIVTLVGPVVTPGYNYPSVISRYIRFKSLTNDDYEELRGIDKSSLNETYERYARMFRQKLGMRYIDPMTKLCVNNRCYFSDYNGSYFADKSHLSEYGRSFLKDLFHVLE